MSKQDTRPQGAEGISKHNANSGGQRYSKSSPMALKYARRAFCSASHACRSSARSPEEAPDETRCITWFTNWSHSSRVVSRAPSCSLPMLLTATAAANLSASACSVEYRYRALANSYSKPAIVRRTRSAFGASNVRSRRATISPVVDRPASFAATSSLSLSSAGMRKFTCGSFRAMGATLTRHGALHNLSTVLK